MRKQEALAGFYIINFTFQIIIRIYSEKRETGKLPVVPISRRNKKYRQGREPGKKSKTKKREYLILSTEKKGIMNKKREALSF